MWGAESPDSSKIFGTIENEIFFCLRNFIICRMPIQAGASRDGLAAIYAGSSFFTPLWACKLDFSVKDCFGSKWWTQPFFCRRDCP